MQDLGLNSSFLPLDADPVETRSGEMAQEGNGPARPRFIAGIGASAGGLESLEKLFRNLPIDTGMAFVVLQHLSPDFKSMMFELLGRDTSMTIHRAEDGMVVEANSIYLLPPKKEMVIQGGRLRVTDKDLSKGLALPIDLFLESLATDQGDQSVAIILSGSGSDGSRGVVEIAKQGGFVICESPQTAKFDGMPTSAVASGVVDEVLPPEQIGELLARIASQPEVTRTERIARGVQREDNLNGMAAIYQLFRRHHDIDFSVYKDSTILRRIHRRVVISGCAGMDDYAQRLINDPVELDLLYGDLLIGVTQFFRDPETFLLLKQTVLRDMVETCNAERPLRAWVSGCATGEEAYSLAIAIHEAFALVDRPVHFKLFATDVHKASIEHAGRGLYRPEVLKGLSTERLKKYFIARDDGFAVAPIIRKSIVFAPHNVLSDAPFTDLDLVSCRNMLIYFQPVAQTRALSLFHYSLNKGGVLLLGGSESVGELATEFEVIHERAKIYRKRRQVRLTHEFRTPIHRPTSDLHASPVRSSAHASMGISEMQILHDQLLNRFMPPSLLIDENRSLIDSFGGAEKLLRLQPRHPSLDVLDLIDPTLRTTLAGAIGRSLKETGPVKFSNVLLRNDEGEQAFNLIVTPLSHASLSGRHHLISLESLGPRHPSPPPDLSASDRSAAELDSSRVHIRQLEDDLRYSRENLQSTIEELETSNEELQATNEELIASNEELQSTNEELHSVNEELYTVNAEHQRKIGELAELNQDMNHLLENTDVATIFLDRDLRVRRFTKRVKRVFDLVEHDIGRSIDCFSPKLDVPDLKRRLREVIDADQPQELEAIGDDRTVHLMRLLPYRAHDCVEGVVMMLVDVSSIKQLQDRIVWMSAIVESTDDAIVGTDMNGTITSWNVGAQRLYGYASEEAIGQPVAMLVPDRQQDEVADYHRKIMAGQRTRPRDTVRVRRDGTHVNVSLTVSPVYDAQNRLIGISKIARDVTARIAMENEIRQQVEKREAFLATLSHELRNPLNAALNASRLIRDSRTDAVTRDDAAMIVERQIMLTRSLLADLLDMSRISCGKITLKIETVDLVPLVDLVRETSHDATGNGTHQLVWKVPPHPVWVRGDAMRLVQMQVNLIHNAMKYSPPNSEICVSIQPREDWVVIAVTDRGVGIAADELDRIFDPFVQVGTDDGHRDGGLGIGLTLVRSLTEEHGGRVEAESAGPDMGSTFKIWLPAFSHPPDAPAKSQRDLSGTVGHKAGQPSVPRRIVLIEDIDDSRRMLTSLLQLDGHKVFPAADGESGLRHVAAHRPDLVLVDIGLPGIDGYEVARRLRRDPSNRGICLIALTGFGQSTDVTRAHEAGFDHHLVKPIEPEHLNAILATALPKP